VVFKLDAEGRKCVNISVDATKPLKKTYIKIPISTLDEEFLDKVEAHHQLSDDDTTKYKLTGDGGACRRNMVALGILCGYFGPGALQKPAGLTHGDPSSQVAVLPSSEMLERLELENAGQKRQVEELTATVEGA
jgi:hypothetical protein